jgi:hypothetical protein
VYLVRFGLRLCRRDRSWPNDPPLGCLHASLRARDRGLKTLSLPVRLR